MDQTQLISVGVGLAFVALLCLAGVNNALRRRRAFERELAATRAGQYPPFVAYQRYSQAKTGGQSVALLVILIVVALAFGAIVYTSVISPDNLIGVGLLINEDQYIFFWLLAPALFLPAFLYTLLGAVWADAPAFAQLRGLPTRPADLVTLRLKVSAVNLLPLTLIMEGAATLFAFGVNGWYCLIGAIVAIFLAIMIIGSLGPVAQRWYFPSEPIERTQWAEWGARAQAWARLAGVRIGPLYVRYTAKYGVADGARAGRKPQTFFLSDVFLQNSDWRQRDALTCLLLVGSDRNRRQAAQRAQRRGQSAQPGQPGRRGSGVQVSWNVLLVFVAVIVITAALTAFGPQILQALPFSFDPIIIVEFIPIAFIALFIALYWRTVSRARKQGPPANNMYSENDLAAVALCGDPLAVMAAIFGVNLLSGITLDRRYAVNLPSVMDRIAAIEQAMLQPGPYAPWAHQPIPSLTPVQMGPYTLSAPITPEAVTEHAAPVPLARYPVTNSPWAATPVMAAPHDPYNQFAPPAVYPPPPEAYLPGAYQPGQYAPPPSAPPLG